MSCLKAHVSGYGVYYQVGVPDDISQNLLVRNVLARYLYAFVAPEFVQGILRAINSFY